MEQVNIYIADNFRGFKEQNGVVEVIFETIRKGEPRTVEYSKKLERMTPNQATLTGMILALARMKKPCELDIYIENQYVEAGVDEWLKSWRENDWINSRGKTVENIAEWQILDELLSCHEYRLHVKEDHSYRKWLANKCDKYEEGGAK